METGAIARHPGERNADHGPSALDIAAPRLPKVAPNFVPFTAEK
jgi:hypothetical protein